MSTLDGNDVLVLYGKISQHRALGSTTQCTCVHYGKESAVEAVFVVSGTTFEYKRSDRMRLDRGLHTDSRNGCTAREEPTRPCEVGDRDP
eukprot:781795-Prorocentrum_minimum.AAC.1